MAMSVFRWKPTTLQATATSPTRPRRHGQDKGRPRDDGALRLERLRDPWGSIADGPPYHREDSHVSPCLNYLERNICDRLCNLSMAFLFQSPGYMPPPEEVMRGGICAGCWWFQSGSLALSGASSSIRVATDVLASFIPIIVTGYAIFDFWRGLLPLSSSNNTALTLHSPSALGRHV
jgi:hypothetical protein